MPKKKKFFFSLLCDKVRYRLYRINVGLLVERDGNGNDMADCAYSAIYACMRILTTIRRWIFGLYIEMCIDKRWPIILDDKMITMFECWKGSY